VNVSAWLLVSGNTTVLLPVDQGLRIQPNATLTLHFSSGTNTATDFYLGQVTPAVAIGVRPGDRLILATLTGQVASVYQLP
jgi:hypothetical protein